MKKKIIIKNSSGEYTRIYNLGSISCECSLYVPQYFIIGRGRWLWCRCVCVCRLTPDTERNVKNHNTKSRWCCLSIWLVCCGIVDGRTQNGSRWLLYMHVYHTNGRHNFCWHFFFVVFRWFCSIVVRCVRTTNNSAATLFSLCFTVYIDVSVCEGSRDRAAIRYIFYMQSNMEHWHKYSNIWLDTKFSE